MSILRCKICGGKLRKRKPEEVGILYNEEERECEKCGALYVYDGELHYCGDPNDLKK